MEQTGKVVGGKFACPSCGKKYAWKPQLAGKRAKCTCGATITVPQAEEAPAAESNPLDDVYDFAPTDPPAAAPKPRPETSPAAAVPLAAGTGAGTGALGYVATRSRAEKYRRKKGEDLLFSRPRDVYLPYGLIVAGGVAMIAWAMYELGDPVGQEVGHDRQQPARHQRHKPPGLAAVHEHRRPDEAEEERYEQFAVHGEGVPFPPSSIGPVANRLKA